MCVSVLTYIYLLNLACFLTSILFMSQSIHNIERVDYNLRNIKKKFSVTGTSTSNSDIKKRLHSASNSHSDNSSVISYQPQSGTNKIFFFRKHTPNMSNIMDTHGENENKNDDNITSLVSNTNNTRSPPQQHLVRILFKYNVHLQVQNL